MGAIFKILDIHTEDAAFLWLLRDDAIKAPHYDLNDLAELDSRLEAHLDGLYVAGEAAWPVIEQNLALAEPGEVFVAGCFAITRQDGKKLDRVVDTVLSAGAKMPALRRALASAFSWCIHGGQAWVDRFLASSEPLYNYIALVTCAHRRVDLGSHLGKFLSSQDISLCSRTLRAVGELGKRELLPSVRGYFEDKNLDVKFWSLWSGCILGDNLAMESLKQMLLKVNLYSELAIKLYCRKVRVEESRELIRQLVKVGNPRLAVLGAGCSGDPFWIPGLLKFMEDDGLARVAGESVSMITGLDLAFLDLDRGQPRDYEFGPNENPADENIELDPDEDLPWPEAAALESWWRSARDKFVSGERYLCGSVIQPSVCREVLQKGYQRQRTAASIELALCEHGFYNTFQSGVVQKREC